MLSKSHNTMEQLTGNLKKCGCLLMVSGDVLIVRGQILMDFVLKEEPNFIGKLAIVSVNEKLGILKDDFSYLVKPEFSQIKEFGLGTVLFVQKNGFWGIMKNMMELI